MEVDRGWTVQGLLHGDLKMLSPFHACHEPTIHTRGKQAGLF